MSTWRMSRCTQCTDWCMREMPGTSSAPDPADGLLAAIVRKEAEQAVMHPLDWLRMHATDARLAAAAQAGSDPR